MGYMGSAYFSNARSIPYIQNLTQLNMMRLVNRSPADQYLPNNLPSVQSSPPSIWPPCSVPRWSSCLVCVPATMMTVVTASPFKKFYLGQKHVWGSGVSKRAGFLSNTHHALHLYTFYSAQVQDICDNKQWGKATAFCSSPDICRAPAQHCGLCTPTLHWRESARSHLSTPVPQLTSILSSLLAKDDLAWNEFPLAWNTKYHHQPK